MTPADTTIVIPTIGRDSLHLLLDSLAAAGQDALPEIIVVDDRPEGGAPLDLSDRPYVRLLRSGGGGPAAARNRGWRSAQTTWVSFLDDDVLVHDDWVQRLELDLSEAPDDVVAVQGRVTVPPPEGRRPTDAERGTAGLQTAQWITADMSVRRRALRAVGGFDERFRRAYREDSDLGLRLHRQGQIISGRRAVLHPVRADGDWLSLRQQRGNADDALMRALHGARWRAVAGAPAGALRRHVAVVASALGAVALLVSGRPRAAGLAAALWAALVARFTWSRIAPGPRDRHEVRRMVLTSVAIPFAATWWAIVGRWRHRAALPRHQLPDLVLFDRDGTLVHDVPYNRDPALVAPVRGAARSVGMLRRAGVATGVVTNQSGLARGLITVQEVAAVNQRVDETVGPFDTWQMCPHHPEAACDCRKPAPAMVRRACDERGVDPSRCVVIGDIGADVEAAAAAGASGILVPTAATSPTEVAAAARVRPSVLGATRSILRGDW
jgi:HAD superfamily hydrolase (TIGR01662 family)